MGSTHASVSAIRAYYEFIGLYGTHRLRCTVCMAAATDACIGDAPLPLHSLLSLFCLLRLSSVFLVFRG